MAFLLLRTRHKLMMKVCGINEMLVGVGEGGSILRIEKSSVALLIEWWEMMDGLVIGRGKYDSQVSIYSLTYLTFSLRY